MTASAAIFQSTITKSVEWIAEVMSELVIQDEHKALRALRPRRVGVGCEVC